MRWAMQPSVDDVSLEWTVPSSVQILTLPRTVPPLFEDECLIVYAVLSNLEQVSTQIIMSEIVISLRHNLLCGI